MEYKSAKKGEKRPPVFRIIGNRVNSRGLRNSHRLNMRVIICDQYLLILQPRYAYVNIIGVNCADCLTSESDLEWK